MTPVVSFVVPCYKLAHLLSECVNSILGQTYGDFEILIMDDCSPDNTPEIARSFTDPRVKHIRNEPNLGSLRNYNKGISLARGKYIWLISADDYLRRPYILAKYVSLLDANPNIGYVFCAGVGVLDGRETKLIQYATYGNRDRVVRGHRFLRSLIKQNIVLAASGLVRRECYEKIGVFPLDRGMIWSGDWYLWCLFALHYDVGYFAEPMVCYREHVMSMTNILKSTGDDELFAGDVMVPWMIIKRAASLKMYDVSRRCFQTLPASYAQCLGRARGSSVGVTLDTLLKKFDDSLRENSATEAECVWLRARVYVQLASHYYWQGDRSTALGLYRAGLNLEPWMITARAKMYALRLGKWGDRLRKLARIFRN